MKQVYSVYDYPTRRFQYYEAPLGVLPASGGFRAPKTVNGVVVPESVAVHLPPGATPTGTGIDAKGLVATMGGIGDDSSSLKLPLLLAAGMLWWIWHNSQTSSRS